MSDAPEIKVKLTAEDAGVSASIREPSPQLMGVKKQETAQSGLTLEKAFEGLAAAGLSHNGSPHFSSSSTRWKLIDFDA